MEIIQTSTQTNLSNSKKVSDFSESVVIQSDLFRVCVIPSVTVTDRQTEIGLT